MHQRNVGIAFCEDYNPAHGRIGGLVFLTFDDSIGDRGGWYPTLEALCRDFGLSPAAELLENAA